MLARQSRQPRYPAVREFVFDGFDIRDGGVVGPATGNYELSDGKTHVCRW